MKTDPRDLGLSYEAALHGVQTAIAYGMNKGERHAQTEPKHLRTGVNAAMSDNAALADLLVRKGIITVEEYQEATRLWMNNELASYEEKHAPLTFR